MVGRSLPGPDCYENPPHSAMGLPRRITLPHSSYCSFLQAAVGVVTRGLRPVLPDTVPPRHCPASSSGAGRGTSPNAPPSLSYRRRCSRRRGRPRMGAAGDRYIPLQRRAPPPHAHHQLVHSWSSCLLQFTLQFTLQFKVQFIQRSTTSTCVHRSSGVWRAAAATSWPRVSQQRMAMRATAVAPP